jgi:hypothetical protein
MTTHDQSTNTGIFSKFTNVVMISRLVRWVGHVARVGMSEVHENLVENPEGRRTIGRSRNRWENNINVDLYELDLG